MPKKPDIDALYEQALSLEVYAHSLYESAQRARIALALAIRTTGQDTHDQRLAEADRALAEVDLAADRARDRYDDLAAEKKK